MDRIAKWIILLLFALASCTTNKSTIDELASMEQELEQDSESFDEQDWADFMDRYDALEKKMDQRDYTVQERKQIRKIQGKITATLTKRSLKGLKKQIEDFPELIRQVLEETNGFLEGFEEGLGEDDLLEELDGQEEN